MSSSIGKQTRRAWCGRNKRFGSTETAGTAETGGRVETVERNRTVRLPMPRAGALAVILALCALLVSGPTAWTCAAAAAGEPPALEPTRLYYQPDRAVPINVGDVDEVEREIVLLDFANRQTGRAEVPVEVSEVNLSELFPRLFLLRDIRYAQLLVDGEPTGAPLTLQPLVSRPRPVIQYARRGGGRTPTVVRWEEVPESRMVMSGFRIYRESFPVLHTTMGDITLVMRPDEAPNTVWNFLHLIEGGFYTQIPFHRVVATNGNGDPFVIQAGDPSGTGSGGSAYNIDLEPSELPHDLGVISMARQGNDIDTGSSQFFICLSRAGTRALDKQYTSFGQTVDGIEVVRQIADVPVDASDRPREMPYIESAELTPAPPRVPGSTPAWLQKGDGNGENEDDASGTTSDGPVRR